MGLRPASPALAPPAGPDSASFDGLVHATRRRLCLPGQRAAEVGSALIEAGVDPASPVDLGSSGRQAVTIWWDGRAEPDHT